MTALRILWRIFELPLLIVLWLALIAIGQWQHDRNPSRKIDHKTISDD